MFSISLEANGGKEKNFSYAWLHAAFLCLVLALLSGCGKQTYSGPQPFVGHAGDGNAIVQAAKNQIGRPYVLGGDSPRKGFDCSGLVFWAYKINGLSIPRVSTAQAQAGRRIGKEELRPGDIVVFKTTRWGYHTGIYAGGRSFIHSPRSGYKVRQESMDLGYWKNHWVMGRRIRR